MRAKRDKETGERKLYGRHFLSRCTLLPLHLQGSVSQMLDVQAWNKGGGGGEGRRRWVCISFACGKSCMKKMYSRHLHHNDDGSRLLLNLLLPHISSSTLAPCLWNEGGIGSRTALASPCHPCQNAPRDPGCKF